MKEKKSSKKVQNRHRPLGPSQLRQRFLRLRHDDPEYTNQGQYRDYPLPVDTCWNCYDPQVDCFDSDDDSFDYNLSHLWTEVANPYPPHNRLQLPTDNLADHQPEDATIPVVHGSSTHPAIEERLADYVTRLQRLSVNDLVVFRRRIAEAIGDPYNVEIINLEYAGKQDTARRICMFAPFWKRRPQTWNKDSGADLLDHLFVSHDVPRFLYSEWSRVLSGLPRYHSYGWLRHDMRFKWICWFILLGQGGSLKRAARLFNWRMPSKLPCYLADAPPAVTPLEGCLFSEIKRLGGSEIEFVRILQNPAFVVDPTEHSAHEPHSRFWQDTIRWLIAHRNAVTDEECDMILSWAMHEHTEARRAGERPYTWKGRRVRSVLERSIAYRRIMERPWGDYAWNAHGWDWTLDEEPSGKWLFVELTSGEALFREGQAMRHCVAGYAARCVSGQSAIVSVAHNGLRRVTLEINPQNRKLVQARGVANRPAYPEEQRAITRWMNTVLKRDAAQ